MWFSQALFKPLGIVVFILLFISLASVIWLAPQIESFSQIWQQVFTIDKWLLAGLAVVGALLVLAAASQAFYSYITLSFEFNDNAFKITRGFLTKEEVFMPYQNIQNVNIRQEPLELFWGLSTVLIWTSSAGDPKNPDLAEGYVPGLSYQDAQKLTTDLLNRIKS